MSDKALYKAVMNSYSIYWQVESAFINQRFTCNKLVIVAAK